MQQPRILITVQDDAAYDGLRIRNDYLRALCRAGAQPLLVPHGQSCDVPALLATVQGVLLTGGGDPHPACFGQKVLVPPRAYSPARDRMELALVREAFARRMPLFGICRGMQMLNVALGGTLYQDLRLMHGAEPVMHDQTVPRSCATHTVWVSHPRLQALLGRRAAVNSFHHQGIARVAPVLTVAACSADGLPEAVWCEEPCFCMGVQWHPECLPAMQGLFDVFVRQAACCRPEQKRGTT